MIKRIMATVLLVVLLLVPLAWAYANERGFTRQDRERLIRLEATMKVFMEQVDKRFEQVNRRFE